MKEILERLRTAKGREARSLTVLQSMWHSPSGLRGTPNVPVSSSGMRLSYDDTTSLLLSSQKKARLIFSLWSSREAGSLTGLLRTNGQKQGKQ